MGWSIEQLRNVPYSAVLGLVFHECPECGQKGLMTAAFKMPEDEYEPVELPCGCQVYIGTLDNVTIGWK